MMSQTRVALSREVTALRAKIKVAIIDSYILRREALHYIMSKDKGLAVVGEAGDALKAIALMRTAWPDVVLIKASTPLKDGLDLIKDIVSLRQSIKAGTPQLHTPL